MSGPLTTSGVVNWDAMSSRSVNFFFAVLARLEKAGISSYTVEVGRIVCRSFPLEASAQVRIADAIFKLARYGSYGNTMWFGFGIKQVVTDLVDTEQGMALVALCAALGTIYEPFFSAQVLKELCTLSGAPRDVSPALRQWEVLLNLCGGILTTGGFMDLVNGFNRLVFGRSVENPHLICGPTTHGALAKAITTLAEVAQRRKANASFVGGLDCAWLAALAEWVLCLDVSVIRSNGTVIYRSRLRVSDLPQVTILIPEHPSTSLLSSQSSVVPSGEWTTWISRRPSGESKLHRRSPRSSILRDTFGSSIDALLEKETSQLFALYLEPFPLLQRKDPRLFGKSWCYEGLVDMKSRSILDHYFFDYPMEPLLWTQENDKFRQFRKFGSNYIPELADCLQAANPTVSLDEAENLALRALESISDAWPLFSGQNNSGTQSELNFKPISVKAMVRTIATFLSIMFVNDVDDDVCPSVDGLASLYSWHLTLDLDREKGEQVVNLVAKRPVLWLDLVFYCLSGVSHAKFPDKAESDTTLLARAGGGICVYYRALENPIMPPGSIIKLHVVRGYITQEGSRFDGIRDIPTNFQGHEERLQCEELPDNSTKFTIDMMIQEIDLSAKLASSFRVHYLGTDGKSHSVWLRLGELYRKMQGILRLRRCHGNCDPLYSIQTSPTALCSWRNSSKASLIIKKEKVLEVQEAVESLRHTSTVWMLTTVKNQKFQGDQKFLPQKFQGPFTTTTTLGQPFLLYVLMLQQEPLSLSPFTRCLSCIVELGSWVPMCRIEIFVLGVLELDTGGVVELIGPSGGKLEVTWEKSARGEEAGDSQESDDSEIS